MNPLIRRNSSEILRSANQDPLVGSSRCLYEPAASSLFRIDCHRPLANVKHGFDDVGCSAPTNVGVYFCIK